MIRLVTLAAGFFLATPFVFAQEASFEGLGNLPGGVYPQSDAQAVSIDGSVVVGASTVGMGDSWAAAACNPSTTVHSVEV